LVHSNLGGLGPDVSATIPPSIRYVNVGTIYSPTSGAINFDLEVTNRSRYSPFNASLNTIINGNFAQINVACNTSVDLRLSVRQSCTNGSSCVFCDSLGSAAKAQCYTSGCDCFGVQVTTEQQCSGAAAAAARASYGCTQMSNPITFPSDAMVSMTVYDFDTGSDGKLTEELTMPGYVYWKTPLHPASDNFVSSTITVDRISRTFRSNAAPSDGVPSHPKILSDDQASR